MALNPQGLLPLLIDNGNRYFQSLAAIEYLDETYPEPPIMPKDIEGRFYVRAVSQMIACEIHPLNNVRELKHLKQQFDADEDAVNAWYRHWISQGLSGIENYFKASGRPREVALLSMREQHSNLNVQALVKAFGRWPSFVLILAGRSCRYSWRLLPPRNRNDLPSK